MNILADASLPGLTQAFPAPFKLTLYKSNEEISYLLKEQDVLLCRANLKVNESLLPNHSLHYVATASSGSDHLDHYYLTSQGITVLDAKGCNALAVADYVLSSLAYLKQHQYFKGKKIGIIGMGHVGTQVYQRLSLLGFEVIGYDPLRALQDPFFSSCSKELLYHCDLLCIHAQLHDQPPYPSRNLINAEFLNHLASHCIILNAARGELIDEEALLHSNLKYCTDVYHHEPQINPHIVDKAILCTPHIAGHSLEAKWTAVSLVSQKLHTLLGWSLPDYTLPANSQKISISKVNWERDTLTLYNPINETISLKEAADLSEAFLLLRQQHTFRHDFLF